MSILSLISFNYDKASMNNFIAEDDLNFYVHAQISINGLIYYFEIIISLFHSPNSFMFSYQNLQCRADILENNH
jgi:hypothetical protein